MPSLVVAAYGQLSPNPNLLDSNAEEDLYSVFLARSELMRWSNYYSTTSSQLTSPLWAMNEAELSYANDGSAIGFAQVGLDADPSIDATEAASQPTLSEDEIAKLGPSQYVPARHPIDSGPPTDPAMAIPPLVQCLDDALRWFGETDVSAFQVTATHLPSEQRSNLLHLGAVLNWFNIISVKPKARAVVTVAADQWDERAAAQVFAFIQRTKSGSFEIGPLITAPDDYAAQPDWQQIKWPTVDTGVAVSLPEWSPAAVGWVIATLFDAILSHDPAPQHLSVRVTRTEEPL